MEINEGAVVIVATGQAGTFIGSNGSQAAVLLRNGEIWHGHPGQMHIPTSPEEEAAALIEQADRFVGR